MENILNCGPHGWVSIALGVLLSGVLILAAVSLVKDLVSAKGTAS